MLAQVDILRQDMKMLVTELKSHMKGNLEMLPYINRLQYTPKYPGFSSKCPNTKDVLYTVPQI